MLLWVSWEPGLSRVSLGDIFWVLGWLAESLGCWCVGRSAGRADTSYCVDLDSRLG